MNSFKRINNTLMARSGFSFSRNRRVSRFKITTRIDAKEPKKLTDPITLVQALRRPRLLIRAAMHGRANYNRNRALKRLALGLSVPSPHRAIRSLLSVEADLETARCTGDASYRVSRHVEVLIALLSEAHLLADSLN